MDIFLDAPFVCKRFVSQMEQNSSSQYLIVEHRNQNKMKTSLP